MSWAAAHPRPRLAAVALGVAVVLAATGCNNNGPATGPTVPVTTVPGPYDHEYVIPAGTGAMLDSGARPAVFPTSLDVRVGETIQIVNNDDRGHTMGTFYVLANSTLTYRFTTAGTFIGDCSLNPGEEFVLTVTE
jgi:hypothetical protein